MKLTQNADYIRWLNVDRLQNLDFARIEKEKKDREAINKLNKHLEHQKGIYTRISVTEKKRLRRGDLPANWKQNG